MLTRRGFATFAVVSVIGARCGRAAVESGLNALDAAFAKIEAESGGRLGVAVLDTSSGTLGGHRVDERFPMCSTFKPLAAAAILARVDAGKEQLARRIPVEQKDILSYAPITRQHVGQDMLALTRNA